MKSFKLSDRKTGRGDTIVEVMVAIAVLAFAMGGAYVLSNRSLRTAVEANQRKEATAIAQGQVELLRNAYKLNPVTFQTVYKVATDYCILNDLTKSNADTAACSNPGYDSTQYRVLVHWDGATNSDFQITVYWDNINGRGPTVTDSNPCINAPSCNYTNQSVINVYYRTPT